MSDNSLAVFNPQAIEAMEKLATTLSQSSLIPDSLRGKPRDALVVLMTGAELGLQPMQALRSIAVVKGKPSLSADLMVSLVKQRKDICEHLVLVKSSAEVATYRAKRAGEPEPTEMSFTMQDAQRAGLAGSDTYRKFPAAMLRARCASAICRAVFPDVVMGLYDSDSGELTDGQPPQEKDVTPAKAARGLEAIPTLTVEAKPALPAASLVVDVAKGETEEAAEKRTKSQAAARTVKAPPQTLREQAAELEAWLAKYPKHPKRKEAGAKLDDIRARIAAEEMREPGDDSEPPPLTDADAFGPEAG